jgi:hypothetical protein
LLLVLSELESRLCHMLLYGQMGFQIGVLLGWCHFVDIDGAIL